MRTLLHRLSMGVGQFIVFVMNNKRNAQLWFLAKRYGGRDKIPDYEIERVFGMVSWDETVKTIRVTSAIQDIAKFYQRDYLDFGFTRQVGQFMNGMLLDVHQFDRIMAMREAEDVNRMVYETMCELGDITPQMDAFYVSGEKAVVFQAWLDTKRPVHQ